MITLNNPVNKKHRLTLELNEQLSGVPEPKLRIEFRTLPSWNDYLSIAKHFGMAASFLAKWRKLGEEHAIRSARQQLFGLVTWQEFETQKSGRLKAVTYTKIKPHIFEHCEIVLRIWRPTFADYDVFNPCIKPIVDGFVDAGVVAKDSCWQIPSVKCEFMGVDDSLKLSPEAREQRQIEKRIRGGKAKRQPVVARYYFDFYDR